MTERKPDDVVNAIYGAWNGGAWGLEHFHPDVEWELTGAGTVDQAGVSRGRDALLAFWRQFWDAWRPGARWAIDELRSREDRVLACGRLHAHGRSSGLEASMPVFHVWTVRDGVVVRFLVCDDRATALRASGADADESAG